MAKQTLSKASTNNILQGVENLVTSVVDLSDGVTTTTTTHALPVYDKEGTLLGYIPVYAKSTFDV